MGQVSTDLADRFYYFALTEREFLLRKAWMHVGNDEGVDISL